MILSVIRIALAVYVGLCVLLVFRQKTYIYIPGKDMAFSPLDVGLEFEAVNLQTVDNESLVAWYVSAEEPDAKTILFCHGNAGDLGSRVDAMRTLHDLGFNIFFFDYRGYGHSTGSPTEGGTYQDARAAWAYLVKERGAPAEKLVIYGRSLGGAVAVRLASEVGVVALVLESTFSSARDMAAGMFPLLPSRLLCRYRYNSHALIDSVNMPVLIAHSREDEMIPFKMGQRLFARAKEPKAFYEGRGGHNEGILESDAEYQEMLKAFVSGE